MRKTLIMLVLSVLIGCVAVGGTTSESIVTYDELVEAVASLSDLLDRATYLAIAGFSAYDAADQRVTAQELVNLFEGPSGPNYEAQTADVMTENELGILASFEYIKNTYPIDWFETGLFAQLFIVRDVFFNTEHFLRLSYVSSLEALQTAYSLIGPGDAFRTSYAFLLASRGEFDDPFLVAGIQRFQSVLTSAEVRAFQGVSIQAAIDSLPDGGTLQLEAGVHRERLIITKSVTIVGSPQDDEKRADGVTVLEGVAWDPVIAIASDEPVNIVIEDLVIRGGSSAINLFLVLSDANVTLTLKNVTFLENGTGLVLGRGTLATCTDCRFEGNDLAVRAQAPDEGARGSFTNCVFEGNGSAISAYGNQTITLDTCLIQNGTDPDGDISLSGSALLEMRDSELHRAEGRGILLMDTASMALINNVIETAYSHAIAVASTDASLGPRQDCGVFMGRNDTELPLGTIDGYGNTISGGVCPTSLLFLTEAAPSEVSVALGQSIQWAIDSVADGGVVTIGEGTYHENLDIGKPLTLLGIGEVILTPVDQENPAIQVAETSGVVIQELRIETAAIGIETSQASCRISGCWFRATDVGVQAVTMDSDTVRIEDCTFTGETAGVGVLSLGSGRIEITSSDFVALGSGAVLSGMTSVLVDDCTFRDCYDSIVLLSLVQGVLSGNHIDSSRGSGIRVAAVPSSVLDEMRAAAPNGILDDMWADGPLTLIDNVIQNSMRSGISLCDTKDSEVLTFTGTLLGSGNLIDNMNLLCPVDYDWPEGFFADE